MMLKYLLRSLTYNKYKIILLLFLLYLKKNFKSIMFLLINSTSSGNAYIESEKKTAIKNIKNAVFKNNWRNNYKVLPDNGVTKENIFEIVSQRNSKPNNKISGLKLALTSYAT